MCFALQTERGPASADIGGFDDIPIGSAATSEPAGPGPGDADLRGVTRHRDQLPDHLDFITGLGLRGRKGDDDEVGPSS